METPASQLSVAHEKHLRSGWQSKRGLVFKMLWCDLNRSVTYLNEISCGGSKNDFCVGWMNF